VHEIGIRMALGAAKQNILRLVILEAIRPAVIGLSLGAVAALILTRLLSSFSQLLYGVGSADPLTFLSVSALLIAVAILASYLPAHRATNVDPMIALRHE
jgi:ABC-type antimicrobial peptide transport system permease subunit